MSVFSDEWRKCLREQYKYVVRSNDRITQQSLTEVLESVGFGEEELRHLKVEATIRAEDVPDDFVPDLDILSREDVAAPVVAEPSTTEVLDFFKPHPLECQCPQCVEMNVIPHDEEGQPIQAESDEELAEILKEKASRDDGPEQLSMF